MRLVDTVIRSRNVGRQMAVVETWMGVRRLAFSRRFWSTYFTVVIFFVENVPHYAFIIFHITKQIIIISSYLNRKHI